MHALIRDERRDRHRVLASAMSQRLREDKEQRVNEEGTKSTFNDDDDGESLDELSDLSSQHDSYLHVQTNGEEDYQPSPWPRDGLEILAWSRRWASDAAMRSPCLLRLFWVMRTKDSLSKHPLTRDTYKSCPSPCSLATSSSFPTWCRSFFPVFGAMSISIVLGQATLSLPYQSNPALRESDDLTPPVPVETHEIHVAITVTLVKPTKVTSILVKFSSQQFLHDWDEDRQGSNEFYSQTLSPLSTSKASSGVSMLEAGTHQYSAKLTIPSWLPESHVTSASRVVHRVVAELSTHTSSFIPFNSRRTCKRAVQELYILREAPLAMTEMRYWSGERRSAATSLAVKAAKYARVGGKLKVALRVKSIEQLHSCRVDIVQEEKGSTEVPMESSWHGLPGSTSAMSQDLAFLALRSYEEIRKSSSFTKKIFPMQTIETAFPEPENPEFGDETSATLSTLSLAFPLQSAELQARYESPMYSVSHKIRIRIKFNKPGVKEIVVNVPVTLFQGSASCDDVPPYYEDIYSHSRCRNRSDSVATLPLYMAKVPAPEETQEEPAVTDICVSPLPEQLEQFQERTVEDFLQSDLHMQSPHLVYPA